MASFILNWVKAKLPNQYRTCRAIAALIERRCPDAKLRFDFRDTFGEGFYFDSIPAPRGLKTALCTPTTRWWMAGSGHRYERVGKSGTSRPEYGAVVAPEISATVGVAAAFAVTPLLARQCLQPVKCWGRCGASLHFALSHFGSAGRSANQRRLRQPRKEKAQ